MSDINLKYLNKNFLTLDDLVKKSGVSKEEIDDFIREKLIPKASYEVRQTCEISSPLGDSNIVEDTISYFPKSYADLVKQAKNRNADETRQEFLGKMRQHLLDHRAKEFAYENAVSDSDKLDEELEKEWGHYLNGIYGICTLDATPEQIIEKEVAVKKLLNFLDIYDEKDWKQREADLKQIIAEYDHVSSLFAPYQRESSSRGKYVDKPLQKLGLKDKIKTY